MAMKKKPSPPRGRERRGSERADVRLSMRVESALVSGTAKIVTESQNLSASGVYCHASHYLAPLSKVQLTIVLPPAPGTTRAAGPQELVKCDGIVVRCDQREDARSETPYELACMFTALEPTLRRRIEEFVTWRNLQALRAALAAPAPVKKPAAARAPAGASARRNPAPRAGRPGAARKTTARARVSAKAAAPGRSTLARKVARKAKPAAKRSSRGHR